MSAPSALQRLAALRNDLSQAITVGLRKNRTDLVSLGERYSLRLNAWVAVYREGDEAWLNGRLSLVEAGARDAIRSLNEASSLEEVRANYRTFLASNERRQNTRMRKPEPPYRGYTAGAGLLVERL